MLRPKILTIQLINLYDFFKNIITVFTYININLKIISMYFPYVLNYKM